MIDLLDRALRTLLRRVDGLGHENQIRFQPPDEQWRAAVTNLQVDGQPAASLNVYLAELRQNRNLRSTMRQRSVRDGLVVERLAPSWVECHYLISAWSPAASELVEPTPDEHALLYRSLAILQDAGPVNPSRIYPATSDELVRWREFRNIDLPTEVLPVDGFGKLAEFWGTMGAGHRWKPVVQLNVGLPVVFTEPVERGPLTTTVVLRIGQPKRQGKPDDLWIQIGGRVSGQDGAPVDEAEVMVVSTATGSTLQAAACDPTTGRFLLELPLDVVTNPDGHRLRARAPGRTDAETSIDWQAPSHDITFAG